MLTQFTIKLMFKFEVTAQNLQDFLEQILDHIFKSSAQQKKKIAGLAF